MCLIRFAKIVQRLEPQGFADRVPIMASKGKQQAVPERQGIDLAQLAPQQLQQLSQSLDQEIEFLQNSMQQLKEVQGKFLASQESLKSVNSQHSGKEILVPLTSSLYAAGQLSDDNKVLIDIGTGYYVEKTINEASKYFKRKTDFTTKQMEKIQPVMQEKYNMKQVVVEVLQMKVQAAIQQQAAQKA